MPMEQLRFLLLVLLGLPLVAGVVVAALGPDKEELIRRVSLITTVIALVLAAVLAGNLAAIQAQRGNVQAVTFTPEIVPGADDANPHATRWELLRFGSTGAVQFYLGLDGINVWLVVLTSLLMVSSVLVSWTAVTERVNEYFAWMLVLQTGMMGVFLAFDIVLFYVFFELTLVPLFFLIGIWGGAERRLAARKFFLYTLAGSLITLLGVLAVVVVCYYKQPEIMQGDRLTFSIPELVRRVHLQLEYNLPADRAFWPAFQFWVFLALTAGFAIKVPLVPFHTWLPLAHTEAPTAGSVLLAGVLLKIGAYGFLRLCLPLTPDACLTVGLPLIGGLAVFGIIYGAFCSLVQPDIKKMIAYSSVSHLGFCMLGMFALNVTGLSGSLLQMINHGLSTGALFLLIGMLYERYHTRQLDDYSGMGAKLGLLSCFMVFICLTSIGLPFLNGFVGEALVFFGMIEVRPGLAVVGTAGIILGAWYLLTMLKRVFFGPLKEPHHEGHAVTDLNGRELAALVPIAALCILLGVFPQPVLNTSRPDLELVSNLLAQRQRALGEVEARAPSQIETHTARRTESE
jgi:NADH-quinone oxidoreductase subunit M